MIYWDTSCVVKLYTDEPDSETWQQRAHDGGHPLVSSALLAVELVYALQQKELRGELTRGAAGKLRGLIERHIREGHLRLIPLGEDVLKRAAEIGVVCAKVRPPILVRALDGIHLATALCLKCRKLATTDVRMSQAAAHLGLDLVT